MKQLLGALVLLGAVSMGCRSYDRPAQEQVSTAPASAATTTETTHTEISSTESVAPANDDTASAAASVQNGMTDENVAAQSAAPIDSAEQGVGGSGTAGADTLNSSDNVDYENDLAIGGSGKAGMSKDAGTAARDGGM